MAHLSSCYFCGSAVETPVQTYELPGRPSDDRTTVTLCPTCSEKLSIVLDTSGSGSLEPASDSDAETAPADPATVTIGGESDYDESDDGEHLGTSPGLDADESAGGGESREDGESETETAGHVEGTVAVEEDSLDVAGEALEVDSDQSDTGGDLADESEETDGDDEEIDSGGLGDPFADDASLSGDDPLAHETDADSVDGDDELANGGGEFATTAGVADDDQESPDADGQDTGERPGIETSIPTDTTETESVAEDESAEEATGEEQAEVPSVEESTTEEVAADESTAEGPAGESTAAETAGGESDASAGDSDAETGSPSQTTISALEYNRVMRMLQNREFPVDRDEIVAVASNAYDLTETECAQVIGLAVDRGLLEERDGELYRPEK